MSQNTNNVDDADKISMDRVASVGFSNPASPGDLRGAEPTPESGDVGAADPAGDVDIEGSDQRAQGADRVSGSELPTGGDSVTPDRPPADEDLQRGTAVGPGAIAGAEAGPLSGDPTRGSEA
jgi:hypothetical protein